MDGAGETIGRQPFGLRRGVRKRAEQFFGGRAEHAVETYGVHEKDMPPAYVWKLGRRAGFRRKLFLPLPHEAGRAIYRRDFLKITGAGGGAAKLWLEKLWGYFRAGTKAVRTGRSGLIVMWK